MMHQQRSKLKDSAKGLLTTLTSGWIHLRSSLVHCAPKKALDNQDCRNRWALCACASTADAQPRPMVRNYVLWYIPFIRITFCASSAVRCIEDACSHLRFVIPGMTKSSINQDTQRTKRVEYTAPADGYHRRREL